MTHGIKVEDGDQLGKTIIFAKNQPHAEFICSRFDANYPHLAGHFARAIVSEYSYAQSLVDDLYNPNKPPLFASTAIAFEFVENRLLKAFRGATMRSVPRMLCWPS